ncbi:MAG: hypothetical protein Q8P18_05130 [Pseudomonadota bacterium]|nr:hypothetical protein [Pseudomonadota bacterium]
MSPGLLLSPLTRLPTLLLVACTASSDVDSGAPEGERDCGSGLWGETFSSLEELECGLGPDGPELCHWTLTFGEGTYEWSYSDTGETGTVTCDAENKLTATSSGGTTHPGTFHRTTGRVTWDGVVYASTSD